VHHLAFGAHLRARRDGTQEVELEVERGEVVARAAAAKAQ
jgi:hypothetical protein